MYWRSNQGPGSYSGSQENLPGHVPFLLTLLLPAMNECNESLTSSDIFSVWFCPAECTLAVGLASHGPRMFTFSTVGI